MSDGQRQLVHTAQAGIRFRDMDALGHVNNAVYFTYMEHARVAWLHAVQPEGFTGQTGPVIVNTSCTFLRPLVYPGTVEIRMFLGDPGRTSVGSYYDLSMAGTRYAEGAARIVWIDLASGRPVPLPGFVVALLSAASGGGAGAAR